MKLHSFVVRVLSGSLIVCGTWGQTILNAAEEQQFSPKVHMGTSVEAVNFDNISLRDVVLRYQDENSKLQVMLDSRIASRRVNIQLGDQGLSIRDVFDIIAWQNDLFIQSTVESLYVTNRASRHDRRLPIDIKEVLNRAHPEDVESALFKAVTSLYRPSQGEKKPLVNIWNRQLITTCRLGQNERAQQIVRAIESIPENKDITSRTRYDGKNWDHNANIYAKEMVTFNFDNIPFVEILDIIRKKTRCDVVVHRDVLERMTHIPPAPFVGSTELGRVVVWISEMTDVPIYMKGRIILVGKLRNSTTIRVYKLFGPSEKYDELCSVIRNQAGVEWGVDDHWLIRVKDRVIISAHRLHYVERLLDDLRASVGDKKSDLDDF